MIKLRVATQPAWAEEVLNDFNTFLVDHAAAEKKASGMAMSMLSHYPDKPDIVNAMVDLCIEEMMHFREVVKLLQKKGLTLAPDTKDAYVNALRKLHRKGSNVYLLDRLLIAGIIEARGCERFGIIAQALEPGELKNFYQAIERSEAKHCDLFTDLALVYFEKNIVEQRLDELLDEEAKIIQSLPITAMLH